MEKSSVLFFLLFLVRSIKPGIMSSSSNNNMEEDAWLMKIELKREEPMEAVKGDKGKEATVDPPSVAEQALPTEEEEEDILKPYYAHLTPIEIAAFRIVETVRV